MYAPMPFHACFSQIIEDKVKTLTQFFYYLPLPSETLDRMLSITSLTQMSLDCGRKSKYLKEAQGKIPQKLTSFTLGSFFSPGGTLVVWSYLFNSSPHRWFSRNHVRGLLFKYSSEMRETYIFFLFHSEMSGKIIWQRKPEGMTSNDLGGTRQQMNPQVHRTSVSSWGQTEDL